MLNGANQIINYLNESDNKSWCKKFHKIKKLDKYIK